MADREKTRTRGKTSGPGKKVQGKRAPVKKVPGKKVPPKKAPKTDLAKEFKKTFLGIAILVAVCLTLAMVADILIKPGKKTTPKRADQEIAKTQPAPKKEKPSVKPSVKPDLKPDLKPAKKPEPVFEDFTHGKIKKPGTGPVEKSREAIVYEVFEDVDQALGKKKPSFPEVLDDIPQIVIIIDDIGYDRQMAMELYALDPNITFSVLPFSPFGREISQQLHAKGAKLMLHLPMEPMEYPDVNPGPGALLASMDPDLLLDQLRKNLEDVPGIVGVNNHMGSKLTAQSDKMHQIFTVLKKQDLFFIDSRTAPQSQGESSARLFSLRFAQRDIFLDNVQDIGYITGQFQSLIRIALKHGTAIGIGHPYKTTLETLKIELPKIKGRVRVVPAENLTYIPS